MLVDGRFRARSLACLQCRAKQSIDHRPGCSVGHGQLVRFGDLTLDLRLAQDQRVEAASHITEMGDGGLALASLEIGVEYRLAACRSLAPDSRAGPAGRGRRIR